MSAQLMRLISQSGPLDKTALPLHSSQHVNTHKMQRMVTLMAIVQGVPTKAITLLGRHLQQSMHNVASYLGTYMLGCCQVFAASSAPTARLPPQPKVRFTPLLFQNPPASL